MRVGVLVHDLHGGGAEGVAGLWASCLVDRGHEVVFLLYGPAAAARASSTDMPVVIFPGRSTTARWTRLPWWLRRESKRLRLDVVLSVLDFSNIVALVAALGSPRPVVITEHAIPSLLWRHKGAGGVAKRLTARVLYRRAELVLAVSHAVATDLRTSCAVPSDRVVVLPNPVTTTAPAATCPDAVSGPSTTKHPRLLIVGRCAPEKQVDRALDVVRELRRRGLDWTACVIGDGSLRPALEKSAQQDRLPVEFLGWVSPWRTKARPGDVLIVASDLEGFGNVLVEAAAAGIPSVAASPALGVADALLPEVTGVLSPTSRIEDLADAVLRAAQLQFSTSAVRPWLDRFQPDIVAARLEAVLERAVRGSEPPGQVVTHVGPAPDAQGGMASVLRTYRDAGIPGCRTHFLTSYMAGLPGWSAGPAALVLLRLALAPVVTLGVVHVHLSYGGSFVREGGLAVLASLRGCPVVITVHGSDFASYFKQHQRLVLKVFRRVTTIILLSEAHRALLPPDVQERAVLLPNTVTSEPGTPRAVPSTPQALFAGEVSKRKGVDVLLAAWPQVRSAIPNAELVIAGPPGDVLLAGDPGVTWAGVLNNAAVRSLLRQSRVAVLPSRREAMPMFILEAMAAGRPVISTPVGAIADTVGGGGVLVPVGEVNALAQALIALLAPDGTAEYMGAAARARFQEEYAPEQGLNRLHDIYTATARSCEPPLQHVDVAHVQWSPP